MSSRTQLLSLHPSSTAGILILRADISSSPEDRLSSKCLSFIQPCSMWKHRATSWSAVSAAAVCHFSHVGLCVTPWTVACQAPLSMGILQARIVEWVAMPSSGDLPDPGIKPRSPALQEDSLPLSHQGSPNCVYQGVYSPSEDFLFPRQLTFFPDS